MSFVPIDALIEFDGQVHTQSTGALVAADATPTWAVFQQGNTTAIATGNMTARATTGVYFMPHTASAANGYTVGKMHQVKMTAIVGGVTDITVLARFFCVPATSVAGVMKVDVADWLGATAPAMTGDAFARVGAAGAGLTALGDTRVANLDATVSSRLASGSYAAPPSAATIASTVFEEAMNSHTTAGTFGDKLRAHLSAVQLLTLAAGSTPTSLVLNSSTGVDGGAPSATNDVYKNRTVVFLTGILAKQATSVSSYDGTGKALTVVGLTGSASAGDTAILV